jgi:hypothetical protein
MYTLGSLRGIAQDVVASTCDCQDYIVFVDLEDAFIGLVVLL